MVPQHFVSLPDQYTPYNVAIDIAALKANISFLDVLRSPKQQQNLNKALAIPIAPTTSHRMPTQSNVNMASTND